MSTLLPLPILLQKCLTPESPLSPSLPTDLGLGMAMMLTTSWGINVSEMS